MTKEPYNLDNNSFGDRPLLKNIKIVEGRGNRQEARGEKRDTKFFSLVLYNK